MQVCLLTLAGPLYYLAVLGFKGALLGSYMRIAGFKSTWRRVLQVAFTLVIFNQVSSAIVISIPCLPVCLLELHVPPWRP